MLQEQHLLVLSTPVDKQPLPAASKYQECSLDTSAAHKTQSHQAVLQKDYTWEDTYA